MGSTNYKISKFGRFLRCKPDEVLSLRTAMNQKKCRSSATLTRTLTVHLLSWKPAHQ